MAIAGCSRVMDVVLNLACNSVCHSVSESNTFSFSGLSGEVI